MRPKKWKRCFLRFVAGNSAQTADDITAIFFLFSGKSAPIWRERRCPIVATMMWQSAITFTVVLIPFWRRWWRWWLFDLPMTEAFLPLLEAPWNEASKLLSRIVSSRLDDDALMKSYYMTASPAAAEPCQTCEMWHHIERLARALGRTKLSLLYFTIVCLLFLFCSSSTPSISSPSSSPSSTANTERAFLSHCFLAALPLITDVISIFHLIVCSFFHLLFFKVSKTFTSHSCGDGLLQVQTHTYNELLLLQQQPNT